MAAGFSLIELMVTIAIAGILVALAAPSMTKVIRGNKIQTEATTLVSDLQYARSEAIRRGAFVSVCPSSNGTSCSTANTWQIGWLVFYDVAGNGTYDASGTTPDVALKWRQSLSGTDTIVASTAPATNAITFNREGFAIGMGTTTTMMKLHTSDNSTQATRCVAIDLGGRVTTQIYGAASMAGGTTCS